MMQIARNTTTNLVQAIGVGLGDSPGCAIETITDATLAQIRAALSQPNGGVTLSADHTTVAALPVPGPTQAEQDRAATKTAVQNQLAGIPGTAWGSLTAAQRQTLVVATLYKLGVLDKNLAVLPLNQWL